MKPFTIAPKVRPSLLISSLPALPQLSWPSFFSTYAPRYFLSQQLSINDFLFLESFSSCFWNNQPFSSSCKCQLKCHFIKAVFLFPSHRCSPDQIKALCDLLSEIFYHCNLNNFLITIKLIFIFSPTLNVPDLVFPFHQPVPA